MSETSSKGVELEAARRQALLEAGEELAQAGSWEWIPAESELVWSDNLFRIFGLEPRALTPTPEYVFAATHPDDRDRVAHHVADLGKSGELPPLAYRIVRPDGVVRHLRATLTVAEERDGRPHRMVGWVQDLTEQRRAEREIAAHVAVAEALAEWHSLERGAEQLLSSLAEAMDFAVGVFWVPQGDTLVPRVVWAGGLAELPEFESATRDSRLSRGVGLPGRVWDLKEPINLTTGAKEPATPREVAAVREGLRGAVAIPAIAAEEVLAVVELASREEAELTERLMRSLTGIGYELGQFLGHRRGELEASALTARELEVLELAAQGLSARRTAERLVVSPSTIRTHLENIYSKLGVSDKASAVAKALRHGLIE